jgi:DNA-binding IclR family transcriptional regulator
MGDERNNLIHRARGILEELRQGKASGAMGKTLLGWLEGAHLDPSMLDTSLNPESLRSSAEIMAEVRKLVKEAWIRDTIAIQDTWTRQSRPVPWGMAVVMRDYLDEAAKISATPDKKFEEYARRMTEMIAPVLEEAKKNGNSLAM